MLRLNLISRKFFVKAPLLLMLLALSARAAMALCYPNTTYVEGMGCVDNTALTIGYYLYLLLDFLDTIGLF